MSTNSVSFNGEEAFRGFFDTDGSVYINIVDREKIKTKARGKQVRLDIPLGFEIGFCFTQSKKNQDVFRILEEELKIPFPITSRQRTRNGIQNTETVVRIYITSPAGQKILEILKKYPPLNPARKNDFLVAQSLNTLLLQKINSTKVGLASLVYLGYQTFNQKQVDSTIIKKKEKLKRPIVF